MYRVETDEQAEHEVEALPAEALTAYAEVRTVLEANPWSGESYHRGNPDAPLRTLPFGTSGMVIYLILDDQRRVDLLHVVWIA